MDQHLYKYLVLHRHLCIPQLGSFILTNEPAFVDVASGKLYGPRPVTRFSKGDTPVSEKQFFDFLAAEMGIDEVAAIKQFHDFSYQFRNEVTENKTALLQGVGTLIKKQDGSFDFEPAVDLTELMPPIQVSDPVAVMDVQETVIEESEEEIDSIQTERWGYSAFILFILGAAALILYYV